MANFSGLLSRELTVYPTGSKRIWLLFIAILANFIASYEAQIAPVLPLLLNDLHMNLSQYGIVSALSVVASAISALIFSPMADRHGRVKFLAPSLFLTCICVYCMSMVETLSGLLILRIILSFVDGIAGATTAGLVRDFSPRMGRAVAFGFWTFGPVGANFFSNAMAGWTLPAFHNAWQSQFIIGGTISLISAIVILFNVTDLSPKLRSRVVHNAEQLDELNETHAEHDKAVELPKMREILRYPHIWTLCIGVNLLLLTYLTIASFGTKLLVDVFHYDAHQAAAIAKYFWLFNLVTLLVAGWISDRLQLRKIVSLIGTILLAIYMVFFISLFGTEVGEGQMMIYTSLLGGLIGIAYGPWCALFSENAEDAKASLQSSAWGLFGFFSRVASLLVYFLAPIVVGAYNWGVWMWIAIGVGVICYIPLLFTGKGPWFRKKANNVSKTIVS